MSAGPDRLTAASKAGIPQVISLGGMDIINFGPRDTVPDKFADRGHFCDVAADQATSKAIEDGLSTTAIGVFRDLRAINDDGFSIDMAKFLMQMMPKVTATNG